MEVRMDIITFQKMVDRHDLTFGFSDDYSVVRNGEAAYAAIVAAARQMGDLDKAASIWLEKVRRVLSRIEDQAAYQRRFVADITAP
jgi:ABC-type phosphonate transport system ATPase subunit